MAPTRPGVLDPKAGANFPEILKRQMDLMVAALACGQTRVASLQCSYSRGGYVPRWLGATRGHHDLSHDADTNTAGIDMLTTINKWYIEQFATLLAKLKAVPEAGGTLLDNTLLVWGNELSRGNRHSLGPTPFVLAGRAVGALRTGRYLRYAKVNHNNLLVSICNAMGLSEVKTYGNPTYCTGPLTKLGA